jgi:hypothetical protein
MAGTVGQSFRLAGRDDSRVDLKITFDIACVYDRLTVRRERRIRIVERAFDDRLDGSSSDRVNKNIRVVRNRFVMARRLVYELFGIWRPATVPGLKGMTRSSEPSTLAR